MHAAVFMFVMSLNIMTILASVWPVPGWGIQDDGFSMFGFWMIWSLIQCVIQITDIVKLGLRSIRTEQERFSLLTILLLKSRTLFFINTATHCWL